MEDFITPHRANQKGRETIKIKMTRLDKSYECTIFKDLLDYYKLKYKEFKIEKI